MVYTLVYHDADYSPDEPMMDFPAECQEEADRYAERSSKYCDEGCYYYAVLAGR